MIEQGWAIWLTGLPASGKSTIAKLLKKDLNKKGIHITILESDELRKTLTPYPDYSEDERNIFYHKIISLGIIYTKNGNNIIIDATGHKKKWRNDARKEYTKFLEVYLKCPLEICKKRDPKKIYQHGDTGENKHVPGLQEPYEENEARDLTINCTDTPQENVEKIIFKLIEKKFLRV